MVIRLIRAGEMAHDEARSGIHNVVLQRVPIRRLKAKTVHACVELDGKGMTRQLGHMPCNLFATVQAGDQTARRQGIRVAIEVPGKDIDIGFVANGPPNRSSFRSLRDKEAPDTRCGQPRRDAVRAQTIAISFDHSTSFGVLIRKDVERRPVPGDIVEVDGKLRVTHDAVGFALRAGGVKPVSRLVGLRRRLRTEPRPRSAEIPQIRPRAPSEWAPYARAKEARQE